jgi:HSP20 family molecular chaperone IbpA
MSRIVPFGTPLMLGFEELEKVMERLSKSTQEGFPPYNIEVLPPDEKLKITLAVAGFSEEDLDISVEGNQLIIKGRQHEQSAPQTRYLYKGIAGRQFVKSFMLADGIKVAGASLDKGLLCIFLEKIEPKVKITKIAISKKEPDTSLILDESYEEPSKKTGRK